MRSVCWSGAPQHNPQGPCRASLPAQLARHKPRSFPDRWALLRRHHSLRYGFAANHRTTSNLTQRRVAPPGETYIVYLLKVAGKKISEFPDHDATGNAQAGHGSDRMLLLQSSSRPNPRRQQLPHTSATREWPWPGERQAEVGWDSIDKDQGTSAFCKKVPEKKKKHATTMCFVFKKVEFRVMSFCESKCPISKLEHFLQVCLKRSWLGTPGSERADRSHFSSRPPAWAPPKALLKHPEASVLQRHPPHLAIILSQWIGEDFIVHSAWN